MGGLAAAEHFLFPWHGQHKRLDPTRPMTSWRTAWRSLRKAAGLPSVRSRRASHRADQAGREGRARLGHPGAVRARLAGHDGGVQPRPRKALDEAALALEPEAPAIEPPSPTPPEQPTRRRRVTSHVTSRQPKLPGKVLEFPKESGAPCTTRTCDLLVRSQTLYPAELRARRGVTQAL